MKKISIAMLLFVGACASPTDVPVRVQATEVAYCMGQQYNPSTHSCDPEKGIILVGGGR